MTESSESKRLKGEAASFQELFDDVLRRRGGLSVFSQEQLRIARALTKALAGADVDPVLVERLSAMLPAVVSDVGGGDQYLDFNLLSDDELVALEALFDKAASIKPPPDPGSLEDQLARSRDANRQLRELLDRSNEQEAISKQSEEMWKRLSENAGKACDQARARVKELEAELASRPDPNAHHAPAEGQQTATGAASVVPFRPLR